MEENIKYIKHDKYLEVIFTGERSYKDLNDLMEKVHSKCEETKIYKVLVDIVNAKGNWKEFDLFWIAKRASQLFTGKYKILGIGQKGKIDKFAEDAAVNRGVNVLLTHDKEANLPWLLEDN